MENRAYGRYEIEREGVRGRPDLRLVRPAPRVAGITGPRRLRAGIPGESRAGCARDEMEADGRLRLGWQHNMLIYRAFVEVRRERGDSNPSPRA